MRRSLLALGITLALSAPAGAQGLLPAPPDEASIPLTYVGSDTRVSAGVNEDGDVHGEALQIFDFDGDSAWLAQLWLGQGGAGGVQVDYHWLWGGKTRDDTIERPDEVAVAKAFVAFDQNTWHDRKATLGVGYEKNDFFVDGYLSAAASGNRFVDRSTFVTTNTLSGIENGHAYTQVETITTMVDAFEHPYDHGIGVRLGRHFDEPLLRVRGGLDYEKGKFGSAQLTLSLGVDKYIRNSGWSFTLEGEHLDKSGDFEREGSDDRGWLLARYEFGQSFRPREPYRVEKVERAMPAAAPAPAPRVIRNEVELDGDAFFDFDRSTLRPDAVAALDELLGALRSSARVSRIRIVGHADAIGSVPYNQALSERRAASAQRYLVEHGIPADQIDTRGDGELNPAFPNDTPANRQMNRRVDIEFLTIEETVEPAPPTPTPPAIEWKKEAVAAPAAWIERALRNPAHHKRTVDVYRFERSNSASVLGPRVFGNGPPDARDDALALPQDAPTTTVAVLANDTDPDGDVLSVTAVTPASHGTVTLSGGVVSYRPAAGYRGSDSFTYSISDGFGGSDTATVTITVASTDNRPPVANDDSATTITTTPVTIPVLRNDSDPDGDTLVVATVGTPAHGTAVRNSDGTIGYVAAAGFSGVDTFTYTVSDGRGGSDTAQVIVTVSAAGNRPPVAVDDIAGVLKGAFANLRVLDNDSDPDGDTLTVVSVENLGPHVATMTINADGTIRFEHTHGTQGVGYIRYTISDGHGNTATARVTINVTDIP